MNVKQGGFTLIQLLFVVAIVSGLLYIVIGQQKVLKEMKVTANFNSEVNELTRHIGEVLADTFVCSASVANIQIGQITGPAPTPGTAKVGLETGGTMPNGIINAVNDPAYDPLNPQSGTFFYKESGLPLVPLNREIRAGIIISSMSLVNDGVKDFIRVRFSPTGNTASSKIGGKSIVKDFYITGKKNATLTQFTECNIDQRDNALREICIKVKGSFDETRLCEMTDLIRNPEDLIPYWLYTDGTLNLYPNRSDNVRGSVSCVCDGQRCDRGADYCRCALPSCNTVSGCSGDSCKQIPMTPENFDECTNRVFGICYNWRCRFRAQCGEPPPPYGYFFRPESLRTPLRNRPAQEPLIRPPTRDELQDEYDDPMRYE